MPEIEIISRGVLIDDGKLLVCHAKDAGNTYLPGGHVDFGESAPRSLEREMREEMGVIAHAGRFLGAVEHAFVQNGTPHCEVNLVFEMASDELSSGREAKSMEDYIEFLWLPVEDIGDSSIEPSALRELLVPWLETDGAGWGSTM